MEGRTYVGQRVILETNDNIFLLKHTATVLHVDKHPVHNTNTKNITCLIAACKIHDLGIHRQPTKPKVNYLLYNTA